MPLNAFRCVQVPWKTILCGWQTTIKIDVIDSFSFYVINLIRFHLRLSHRSKWFGYNVWWTWSKHILRTEPTNNNHSNNERISYTHTHTHSNCRLHFTTH